MEVPRGRALREARGVGRPEGPARAGDHGGPGPAPPPHRAGRQRHRQPEADRDAADRAIEELREGQRARPARPSSWPTRPREAGDADKAPEYTQAAEAFANRLIALEKEVADAQEASSSSRRRRPTRPRQAVQPNSTALQKKLTERQKLLSQLDQAKMQEQMNKAMATLSATVGEDVPTLRPRCGTRSRRRLRQGPGHGASCSRPTVETACSRSSRRRPTPRPRPA